MASLKEEVKTMSDSIFAESKAANEGANVKKKQKEEKPARGRTSKRRTVRDKLDDLKVRQYCVATRAGQCWKKSQLRLPPLLL